MPSASQQGAVLNCSMGTWFATPDSYSYSWTIGGNPVGSDSATYDVQPGDAGALCAS